MRRLVYLAAALLLAACGAASEPPPDPLPLLSEAAAAVRQQQTFRMEVLHDGAEYLVTTDIGDVAFNRALAQFVAPDVIQANVSITYMGFRQDLGIFARGEDQWFKLANSPWVGGYFAPGFNPVLLIAEDEGLDAALSALQSVQLIGAETLETGANVWHITGVADGPAVTALLVGMIQAPNDVNVDVYIDRQTRLPVRVRIVQPETATATEGATTWTVDLYDFNAAAEINDPSAEAEAYGEVTLEALGPDGRPLPTATPGAAPATGEAAPATEAAVPTPDADATEGAA